MTKVRYSLAASLNCKFVIALVQRRSLLEEGCCLNMCAQYCLPLLKHSSFAVTNLFGSQFSYLPQATYPHLSSSSLASATSSPWFTWLNELMTNRRLFFSAFSASIEEKASHIWTTSTINIYH